MLWYFLRKRPSLLSKRNKKYRWSRWMSWCKLVWIKIHNLKKAKWWWWWKWWFTNQEVRISSLKKLELKKSNWIAPYKNLVYRMILNSCKWFKKICLKWWQKPKVEVAAWVVHQEWEADLQWWAFDIKLILTINRNRFNIDFLSASL